MEQPARQHDFGTPEPSAAAARTLVIDLEGALLRSELLMEALFSSPGRLLARFGAGGRPGMARSRMSSRRPTSTTPTCPTIPGC
ncbi:hypothetical protein [Bradyrhizobium sp. SEMIA]|uniref:hypothetical protein n=1 Tax=Bradyrhizobium sp. SEMIA TaxID=2597515 RepID=UPI00223ED58C|nr:hypothetical protein [Bradyrhizobium sp. SEMIA]